MFYLHIALARGQRMNTTTTTTVEISDGTIYMLRLNYSVVYFKMLIEERQANIYYRKKWWQDVERLIYI